MTSKRISIGLAIDGLGSQRLRSDGIAFHWGNNAPKSSATDYEWIPAKVQIPRGGWSRLDVLRNRITSNAMTFQLEMSDTVAELLQYTETVPTSIVGAAIDAADTTINLGADLGTGLVVHVGNEAIHLGSGTYSGSGGIYNSVDRGWFGTTAEDHESGSRVYTDINQWKFRPVRVVVHDLETETETVAYRGMITAMPAPNLAVITIQTRDVFGPLMSVQANQEPGDGGGPDSRAIVQPDRLWCFKTRYGRSRILADTGSTIFGAFQVQGALVWSYIYTSGVSRIVGSTTDGNFRLGSFIQDAPDEPEVYEDPAYEVLVIDQAGDDANPSEPISSTQDLTKPYHPLAIALALVKSDGSYDPANYLIFSDEVGAGITYIDTSDWETQIDDSPELDLFVDQLVLGWDGQAFRPFEVATRLIRAAGYVWSITEQQGLSVRQFELPSIVTIDEGLSNALSPYRGSFPWKPNLQSNSSKLYANVGGLPWLDADKVRITVPGESTRAARFENRRYDFQLDMVARERSNFVQRQLNSSAIVAHQTVPVIGMRVAWSVISGVDYDLGAQVALNDIPVESGFIVNAAGQRILAAAAENDEAYIGTIIGRSPNFDDMTVDLELALYGFADDGAYARLRAPSMRVQSYSSLVITGYDTSDYGASVTDAETFEVDDEVSLFYLDHSPVSEETRSISAIGTDGSGNGTITISSAFSDTPDATMIVRPAESSYFSNTSRYSFTDRPYCYYSDSDDEVDGAAGDPFGGGLGLI